MIGTKLAHYEITSHLGSGGMGDVYQAIDSKLGRSVAIKLLPAAFASDPERLSRFRREAQVLASLNHPNIAHVYGLEESGETRCIVMELVEGETLQARLKGGPVPVDEALKIARQIAEALDAAHEKGVVHRDLKPGNVMLTSEGKVKVLDFGLARAYDTNPLNPNVSNSPTMVSVAATNAGVILGTAAYMAPEQARGKTVDKRADIWAFGVILHELLTGQRLFNGEDLTETLASVVKDEPDWNAVPESVRPLLRHCLEKDPKKRLRDIGDFELLLAQKTPRPLPDHPSNRFSSMGWLVVATMLLLVVIALGMGWLRTSFSERESPSLALTIIPSQNTPLDQVGSLSGAPEISPDGSAVMYRAAGALYVRRLDSLEPTLVPGSNRASNAAFWSADSASVFYPAISVRSLIKVRMPDGAPEMVMPLSGYSRSGSQNNKGLILFSSADQLYRLEAPGGKGELVDLPGLKAGTVEYPEFLPDGDTFLFLWIPADSASGEIYLASLKQSKVVNLTLLLKNDTAARYSPAGGGRLLFVRNDNLYSQKLDLNQRKLLGDSQLIEEHVGSGPGLSVDRADFSVSRSGIVVWRPGIAALSQVTVFDRKGVAIAKTGPPLPVQGLRLSPDETRLLAEGDRTWLLDVGQAGRLDLGPDWMLWSSDGSKLIGVRGEKLVERFVTGNGEVRELGDYVGTPQDISRDGAQLLLRLNGIGVQRLYGTPEERAFKLLTAETSGERISGDSFSPDGHWILYRVGEGIFVQPFPGPGLRKQIADQRGFPQWRGDGKEIIVNTGKGDVYSIRVDRSGAEELRFGMPELLFSGLRWPAATNDSSRPLAVSRDGSQIFWPQAAGQPGSDVIHIRTNAVN